MFAETNCTYQETLCQTNGTSMKKLNTDHSELELKLNIYENNKKISLLVVRQDEGNKDFQVWPGHEFSGL